MCIRVLLPVGVMVLSLTLMLCDSIPLGRCMRVYACVACVCVCMHVYVCVCVYVRVYVCM